MPRHNSHGQSKTTAASVNGKQSSEGQPEVAVKSYAAGRNGWAKVIDEEGYTFFYNEATGETQWDAPPDFWLISPGCSEVILETEHASMSFWFGGQLWMYGGSSRWKRAQPLQQFFQGTDAFKLEQ
jgi:WW domain